jgi:hypothetical protein
MADHIRKQLRDAATTRVTNLATTGTRVHGFRVDPLQVTALPALSVWTPSERPEAVTIHAPINYQRDIELRVTGIAAATGDVDDTLDLIAKEVEIALATALTVGGKSMLLEYLGTEQRYERGEKTGGTVELTFVARMFATGAAPDVPL